MGRMASVGCQPWVHLKEHVGTYHPVARGREMTIRRAAHQWQCRALKTSQLSSSLILVNVRSLTLNDRVHNPLLLRFGSPFGEVSGYRLVDLNEASLLVDD